MPRHIYKETSTFHFHNANPKGKNASDCVYRAISVALNQTYEQTVREMCECCLKIGYSPNETKTIKKYLESKGWVAFKEPRDPNNKKISLKRFLVHLKPNDVVIALVGSHHCTLVKEQKVWDTWDCTEKLVHSYWKRSIDWTTDEYKEAK